MIKTDQSKIKEFARKRAKDLKQFDWCDEREISAASAFNFGTQENRMRLHRCNCDLLRIGMLLTVIYLKRPITISALEFDSYLSVQ